MQVLVVKFLLGPSTVDHVANVGNRERCLCHICRDDDHAHVLVLRLLEHFILALGTQLRIKGKYKHLLAAVPVLCLDLFLFARHLILFVLVQIKSEPLAQIVDLFLAREENEDGSLRQCLVDLLDFLEGGLAVVLFCDFAIIGSHWVLTRRNLDAIWLFHHARREEALVVLEVLHAKCCAHDHQSQREVPKSWGFRTITFFLSEGRSLFVGKLTSRMSNPSEETDENV